MSYKSSSVLQLTSGVKSTTVANQQSLTVLQQEQVSATAQPRGDESQYTPENEAGVDEDNNLASQSEELEDNGQMINPVHPTKLKEDMAMNRVKLIK